METARTYIVNAAISLILFLILFGFLAWQLLGIWSGSGIVDQGSRMLIVVSTANGDRPYNVNIKTEINEAGDLLLVIYGQNKALAEKWEYVPIDFQITFASATSVENISCGQNDRRTVEANFNSLSAGAQYAVQVDLISKKYSALNYYSGTSVLNNGNDANISVHEEAEPNLSEPPVRSKTKLELNPEDIKYRVFKEKIGLLSEDYKVAKRWTNEKQDVIWAEECRIPAEHVWQYSKNSLFELASHKSLLAPQINLVSESGGNLTNQKKLVVETVISRPSQYDVIVSYPEFKVGTDGWSTTLTSHNAHRKIFYTEQPVLILRDRNESQRKDIMLLLYGVVAGGMGTLGMSFIKNLKDIILITRRKD